MTVLFPSLPLGGAKSAGTRKGLSFAGICFLYGFKYPACARSLGILYLNFILARFSLVE